MWGNSGFPNTERSEVLHKYYKLFLIACHASVKVSKWSNQVMAKVRLHSIWVRAMPDGTKIYHGLHKVGPTLHTGSRKLIWKVLGGSVSIRILVSRTHAIQNFSEKNTGYPSFC